LVGDILIYRCD